MANVQSYYEMDIAASLLRRRQKVLQISVDSANLLIQLVRETGYACVIWTMAGWHMLPVLFVCFGIQPAWENTPQNSASVYLRLPLGRLLESSQLVYVSVGLTLLALPSCAELVALGRRSHMRARSSRKVGLVLRDFRGQKKQKGKEKK